MAHLVPSINSPAPRFVLKIHDISPERVAPNGDRYTVEVIDFDESILLGQLLVVTQNSKDPRGDPQADPTVERRGVLAAVIVRAGNGHLLGLPDLAPVMEKVGEYEPGERPWPSVEMLYSPGDVVLVDFNARGRDLKILAKEVRIINQIDVLAGIDGMRLKRTDDGGWEREEE